jgi:hypothetical protein
LFVAYNKEAVPGLGENSKIQFIVFVFDGVTNPDRQERKSEWGAFQDLSMEMSK